MSIYECTMVDSEREPAPDVRYPNVEMVDNEREASPDVRCTNVEMVDNEREASPDVRCTNVEKHTMGADFSTLYIHPLYDKREEPIEHVDGPRDVVVVKRRPT